MGYEIIFKYKDATEMLGIYSDEVKEKSIKIGKITENIPLEDLASKIMSNLARRNVLIVDVEIYEYEKKKLSYRETDNGIVIKNKKFTFNSRKVVEFCDFEEDVDLPIQSTNKTDIITQEKKVNQINQVKRILRHEIYDPNPLMEVKVKQRGFKFTVGKNYPILEESSMGNSMFYKTVDDSGKNAELGAEYFIAAGLITNSDRNDIDLWRNNGDSIEMPDIRGR